MNNKPNRDEEAIKGIIKSRDYTLAAPSRIDSEALLDFLISQLKALYKNQTIIVALTGAPGSGKTILVEQLINKLTNASHLSDFTQTDSYNILHRGQRNKLIAEGKKTPLEVKDFALLNRIVKEIKEGKTVRTPIYDEVTGDAVVVGEKNFPHHVPANLHFFFVEGDYQPLDNPDMTIYLHLPTDIRRENRVERDLAKRKSYGGADAIRKSFNDRLESQYYPYTLPQATKSDIIIVAQANPAPADHPYRHKYAYDVYTKAF
jgi:uridine kinase